MYSLFAEQAFKREFGDDVAGAEECVHRCLIRIKDISHRLAVNDDHILEHKCLERLEVDLVQMDLSVDALVQLLHHLAGNGSLHRRQLDEQTDSDEQSDYRHKDKSDYVKSLFDNFIYYIIPTCKNSKNIG